MSIRTMLEIALNGMNPAIATAWENDPYSPANGVPYQIVNLLRAEPENPTVGPGFYREVGIFQVTLMYPLGIGPAQTEARAVLLRSTFKRGTSLTDGQIALTMSRTPQIAPGRIDGDRWAVPVKTRFFANIFE